MRVGYHDKWTGTWLKAAQVYYTNMFYDVRNQVSDIFRYQCMFT